MDFTTAISFGRFAFLKLTDFTDFCKNSVACETFLWYDNVYKFKELANAQIAQLVEQRTENPRVAGSIPALGIFFIWRKPRRIKGFRRFLMVKNRLGGQIVGKNYENSFI